MTIITSDPEAASSSSNFVAAAALPLPTSTDDPVHTTTKTTTTKLTTSSSSLPVVGISSKTETEQQQQQQQQQPPSEHDETSAEDSRRCRQGRWFGCCGGCCSYDGNTMAQGYSLLGIARGAIVMSNIFLANSLIYLACEDADGLVADPDSGDLSCENPNNNKVYGMTPSSLITNIAVVSGVLSALFMPIIGAIVDFTPHRKTVGVVSGLIITIIQATQIGTVSNTWFVMSILQAIAGFVYQILVVAVYAYLPELSRTVGQTKMNTFTSRFTMFQFGSQASFNLLIIVLTVAFGFSTVVTGQVSQASSVVWCIVFFTWGWYLMPSRDAKHSCHTSIWTAGFIQNYNTTKSIHQHYSRGLKWYLYALIFAEASTAAITTVSVVYLNDTLKLSTAQIAIFFLIALVGTIPGARLAAVITHYTNPNTSWKLSQLALLVALFVGAFALEGIKIKELSYIWGAVVGVLLGWFYPTENLFFSMCLPKGQEAELAGFFVYCTQILGWLPPLLFSIMNEQGIDQKYGVLITSFGFVVSVVLLSCTAPWPDIVAEAERNSHEKDYFASSSSSLGEKDGQETKEKGEEETNHR